MVQIVNMMRAEAATVSAKACEALWLLVEEGGAAEALVDAAVLDAVHKLMDAGERRVRVASLQVRSTCMKLKRN
jgi:hypothetical protein